MCCKVHQTKFIFNHLSYVMVLRQEINCALKSIQGFFFIFLDFEYFTINVTVLVECCVGDASVFPPLIKYVYNMFDQSAQCE